MKGRLLRLRGWLDARTPRERVMALVGSVAAVGMLWYTVVLDPLQAYRARSDKEIRSIEKEIGTLKSEIDNLAAKLSIDPNEQGRIRKESRERELQRIDEDLQQRVNNLIPPAQMALVLREILVRQRNLKLVELKSLDPEPVLGEGLSFVESLSESVLGGQASKVFKHAFQMEIRGGYLSTLRYLEELEDLPWRFFWKEMTYEVLEYPEARVVLTVETLSLQEGWIGV